MGALRTQKFSSATHIEENAQQSHRSEHFVTEISHKVLCDIHTTVFTDDY